MGYAGKLEERHRARQLRAEAWTLQAIADDLHVAKSTVSLWVRDVEFVPKPRNRGHAGCKPHPLKVRKEAEIERCRVEAVQTVGQLSDRDRLMYALALYAGEGSKRGNKVVFANSDPALILIFLSWLREQFQLDESRLRMSLYLHADLDLDASLSFWSDLTGIPIAQFQKPYRAAADNTLRLNRHVNGCAAVVYCSSLVHRHVMAMIAAVTSGLANPG